VGIDNRKHSNNSATVISYQHDMKTKDRFLAVVLFTVYNACPVTNRQVLSKAGQCSRIRISRFLRL